MNRLRMLAQQMQEMGRNGDTLVGHLTPGEVVIPRSALTPELVAAYLQAMEAAGEDPRRFVVGQGSRNPVTGAEEFYGDGSADDSSYGGGNGGLGSAATDGYGGGSDLSGFAGGSEMGGSRSRPGDPASGYEASEGAAKAINDMLDMNFGGLFGTGFSPRTDGWASPHTGGRAVQEFFDGFSLSPDTSVPTGQTPGFLSTALGMIAGPAGMAFNGLMAVGQALERAGAKYEDIPDRPTDADPATASYSPSAGVQAQPQTNALRQVIPWYVGTIRG